MKTNKRILIVEDEQLIRWSLNKQLVNNGYNCLEAEDGKKALYLFLNESPDLVLLDVNLPDVNGLELLTQFRNHSEKIPMIVSSANAEYRTKAMEKGAKYFFTKPLIFQNLFNAINCLLI